MTHSQRMKKLWQDPKMRARMLPTPERVRAGIAKVHPFDKALWALRTGRVNIKQSQFNQS